MLAIVIPYYKLTFFEETLESLSNQTDKRFKVYIGDDSSPENPSVILEKYYGKFDFVYHRFGTNLGGISLTQQWERCIELSGDEGWIMILGDDDVLADNVVELFYENLAEINLVSNVVRFASCKINHEGNEISSIYRHPKLESSIGFLFRETRSSLSEYVFNKKKVLEIGFRDLPLAWFSDILAVLEFSDFKNVFSINEAQVFIRITDLSISGKSDNHELKAKATFAFYFYLLSKKSSYFTKTQKVKLLKKIDNCYLNNKREIYLFVKISKIYFTHFLVLDYLVFLKSIVLSTLKSINKNANRIQSS